jgi:hypothetical protein
LQPRHGNGDSRQIAEKLLVRLKTNKQTKAVFHSVLGVELQLILVQVNALMIFDKPIKIVRYLSKIYILYSYEEIYCYLLQIKYSIIHDP